MPFNVTIEREKTDGSYVVETHEGVTDFRFPPIGTDARLQTVDGETKKVTLESVTRIEEQSDD